MMALGPRVSVTVAVVHPIVGRSRDRMSDLALQTYTFPDCFRRLYRLGSSGVALLMASRRASRSNR